MGYPKLPQRKFPAAVVKIRKIFRDLREKFGKGGFKFSPWILAFVSALGAHGLLFFVLTIYGLRPSSTSQPKKISDPMILQLTLVSPVEERESRIPPKLVPIQEEFPTESPSVSLDNHDKTSPLPPQEETDLLDPVTEEASTEKPSPSVSDSSPRKATLNQPADWPLEMPAYPAAARKFKQTGAVTLVFRVTLQGTVEDVIVTRSSGHSLLDNSALDTVRRKWVFPPQTEEQRVTREFRFLLSGVE